MKKMTREQYNVWINKMYIDFNYSSFTMKLCKDGRTIIVVSKHGNRIGKATCHEDDDFSKRTGIAIAFARAIGQEIPTVVDTVKISSLCYGDMFIDDNGNRFVYIAKHPTISDEHITVFVNTKLTHYCKGTALVEKI